MRPIFHPSIPAELSQVQPHGDFVLVRRIPEQERPNLIIAPGWRNKGVDGVKRGEVLAVGKGDRRHEWVCITCGGITHTTEKAPSKGGECRHHWERMAVMEDRHPMHVKVGDEVLYHRAPANHISLNGQDYVFLHEEQHVLAVIEQDSGPQSTKGSADRSEQPSGPETHQEAA